MPHTINMITIGNDLLAETSPTFGPSQHVTDIGNGPVFYDCLVEVSLVA